MAKNSKSIRVGPSRRAGSAVVRRGSRQLFDDVLALAAELGREMHVPGARNLQSLVASAQSVTGALTDMPNLRSQAAAAGDSLGSLADYAMHTNVEQMVRDVGAFARRHPVAALAIVVAGTALVASRFKRRPAASNAVRGRPARKPAAAIAAKTSTRKRKGTNGQAHASA